MVSQDPAVDRRPVRRLKPDPGAPPPAPGWPTTVPAVAQILRDGLELGPGATLLVGENGSGKSTVLGARRGDRHQRRGRLAQHPAGHAAERAGVAGPRRRALARWAYFLLDETLHGLYSYLEATGGDDPLFHEMSHGEGFLALLGRRASSGRLYLLDEPDAALSFTGTLSLIATLGDLLRNGSQVVVATHSPVLAALPGARLLEVGPWGLREAGWADLELTASWRQFLAEPQSYLRHLT